MDYNFYKDLHNRELTRRKELDDATNLPIGIISIFIGMLSFFIKESKTLFSDCMMTILFFIIVLLLVISVVFIICSLNNFIVNNSYSYLPLPNELLLYEQQIIEHNKLVDNSNDHISFQDYLKSNYSNIASFNKKINDKRSLALYRSKNCLIVTVFLSLILILIHLLKTY